MSSFDSPTASLLPTPLPKLRPMTDSTDGARFATSAKTLRFPLAMWHRELRATKTSTRTVPGAKFRLMVRCGFRRRSRPDGLLINMDIGLGLNLGAGPGSMMRLGVMRRSTTDAGSTPADIGDGRLDLSMVGRST